MPVYQIVHLGLKYSYIMTLSMINQVLRVVLLPFYGRIAERKGFYFLGKFSVALIGLSTLVWSTINRGNMWFLMPMAYIISALGWAGANVAVLNIGFLHMPPETRTGCIAINAAVSGIFGFLGTLTSSFIIARVGTGSFSAFGLTFVSFHMTYLMSAALLFVTVGYEFFLSHKAKAVLREAGG